MTLVEIKNVATVVRGVSFDKAEVIAEPRVGYVPVLRAGNIDVDLLVDRDLVWVPENRVGKEQRMRPGDIAICMSSGSPAVVGKTATLRTPWPGSVGAFCAIVRPITAKVLPEYLSFFLQSETFRTWTRQSSGANIKNIRKSELESFLVPVPNPDAQRRIVDLLSRAEGIVRLRREAKAKAQQIIPALFLDMFGDPATNPKGWPLTTLAEIVKDGPSNGLYKHKSAYGTGTPILRIDGFYDGVVRDLASLPRVRIEDNEAKRFALKADDIVINRVNSPDYLGKSAIIPALDEKTVFESNMMRLSVDCDQALPRFVVALLQTTAARRHFLSRAKHAINQSSINQQDVKSLPVFLPPVRYQVEFKRRAEMTESIGYQQAVAHSKAEAALKALLARAFSDSARRLAEQLAPAHVGSAQPA